MKKNVRLEIQQEKENGHLSLKLVGRLDSSTAPKLQEIVEKGLADVTELWLDMEALEYISSAGLRVLLMASKKSSEQNFRMVLIHVNEVIMENLEITGFKKILNIQ